MYKVGEYIIFNCDTKSHRAGKPDLLTGFKVYKVKKINCNILFTIFDDWGNEIGISFNDIHVIKLPTDFTDEHIETLKSVQTYNL